MGSTVHVDLVRAIRREILLEVLSISKADAGLLFERLPGGTHYQVVGTSESLPARCGAVSELPQESAFVRWLRVNQTVLPVPDRRGIYELISPREQQLLREAGAYAVVPLGSRRKLPGIVWLCGTAKPIPYDELSPRLGGWAERIAETRAVAESAERARVAERANRLAVAGQVAAGVAHEVRNPLAAIRSSVQLVRDGDVPPERAAPLMDGVLDEIDRVATVLSGVLDAGRSLPTASRPVALNEVVASCSDFLRGYTKVSGLSLDVDVPQAPIYARLDGHELRQVLINLLLNACQASRANSTVTIRLAVGDESVTSCTVIDVIDQGAGMSPETLGRAFGPFFTTKPDGSGLGLAICREIAERNGWQISLTSELGAGTTARVRLPGRTDAANPPG